MRIDHLGDTESGTSARSPGHERLIDTDGIGCGIDRWVDLNEAGGIGRSSSIGVNERVPSTMSDALRAVHGLVDSRRESRRHRHRDQHKRPVGR